MTREIDRRDPAVNQTTPARANNLTARAAEISDALSGDHVLSIAAFDAETGNPSVVASAGAPAETGNFVQRALSHVQGISPVLGLEETQAPEFIADPNVQYTSSGSASVNLQQLYKGIRIFQTAQGVNFNPDGSIGDTVGKPVTIGQELPVAPKLTVQEAVLLAARYIAEPDPEAQDEVDEFGQSFTAPELYLDNFTPTIIATFPDQPESPTVLAAGPFGDEIKANLTWFPLRDRPHLAWELILVMPSHAGQYRVLVDADNGEILFCRQLMMTLAEGSVYVLDGANGRQVIRFPRPLTDYNVPIPDGLPTAFPDPWVADGSARGNAVNAFLFSTRESINGNLQNGVLSFNPADPVGADQQVLNIFFLNCVIHDFLYLYGFRESDGNFQQNNFGRGGSIGDPVTAFAHDGPVNGTANMSTRVDGVSPVMNMGLVTDTGRHTAFDSSVVFHEFMHGVTNRLVGGPLNTQALEDFQSAGMGEGWGDYLACTFNNTTVVGSWVTGRSGGIRKFPYDSNFPDHFGMLGTGRYNRPELNKQHAVGEIWCATLMEMNRRIGKHLGLQLVIDALKLSPVRPSFLDMRDAILKALRKKLLANQITAAGHATTEARIWAAFAKFGMGPNARSNGASLTGIVADFNVPATPAPLDEGSPVAGTNAPLGGTDLMDAQTREAFDDILAAIRIHAEELVKNPNVVLVQPGYRFRGATYVRQPVLSVTVLRKASPADVPPDEAIPTRLGKVSVDVVPATPLQQLEFLKRREALANTGATVPAGEISTLIPGEAAEMVASADESPLEPYVPPSKPLALVNEEMTVLCHASPDAGFRNLRQFISETQERLVSTMYEFNARHILDAITNRMQSPRQMHLILDGGAQNEVPGPPATTISKLAARQTLANSLQNRFECVWAPVADDDLTTVSFFPRAYHTKVSVRDGDTFWLSSGNWKESGQPSIDPIEGPLPPGFDKTIFQSEHNREWHVIINNRSLADTFETYITHDIAQATPIQIVTPAPPSPALMPDLFIPAEGLAAFAGFDSEPQFFREESFTKQVKVQPIMTPDNYPEMILPLIQNAQRSLYFQNQTLSPAVTNQRYMPLFRALRDKTKAAAANPPLDVKVLVSEFTDLQKLIAHDFNLACIKRQSQNHNKGIIIDDEIVIVGSHNWSGQGCTQNRDASLIFFDAEIAAYFKKLFLYDWNRTTVSDSFMLAMPIVAAPGEATPPGMIRVPWSAVFPESREAAEME